MSLEKKEKELENLLKDLESAVIAFSGGVDSTYLLYKAQQALGDNVIAVTAVSETYQDCEKENAQKIAQIMGVEHLIIQTSQLSCPEFICNPPQRCYHCKKELFVRLKEIAKTRCFAWVCEGANDDDTSDFRPGLTAGKEMGVRSPLMEVKLGKDEIRQLSQKAGLSTWDMPSAACLSSRIPYGEVITPEKLRVIATAESFLKTLGQKVVRVRHHGTTAHIEVAPGEMQALLERKEEIVKYLKNLGFIYITLDMEGFRSGSMNETLKPEEKF
ncbi:MAG: ATP-dependent sacrificial sulfur transferase LarE [Bacillota bacterium]|nr:ATP-dependent sacrificial sulfur transferase LarE [Bacillota bacterium]